MPKGHLFIVSGPSGVGKTAVVHAAQKKLKGFSRIITCTTRLPRPHEKNGQHYHFLSKETFQKMIHEEGFLEWAQVHDQYYGTPKKDVLDTMKKGKHILLILDVQGALNLKKIMNDAHLIFLLPESVEILLNRLKKRADMPKEEMLLRLKNAKKELKISPKYDFRLINKEGKMDQTVQDIIAVIKEIIATEK